MNTLQAIQLVALALQNAVNGDPMWARNGARGRQTRGRHHIVHADGERKVEQYSGDKPLAPSSSFPILLL